MKLDFKGGLNENHFWQHCLFSNIFSSYLISKINVLALNKNWISFHTYLDYMLRYSVYNLYNLYSSPLQQLVPLYWRIWHLISAFCVKDDSEYKSPFSENVYTAYSIKCGSTETVDYHVHDTQNLERVLCRASSNKESLPLFHFPCSRPLRSDLEQPLIYTKKKITADENVTT